MGTPTFTSARRSHVLLEDLRREEFGKTRWYQALLPLTMPTISSKGHTIQRSRAEPVPLETHPYIFKVSISVTWCLWFLYTVVQTVLIGYMQYGSQILLWRLWIISFAECCLFFQDAVTIFGLLLGSFSAVEDKSRLELRLIGDEAPSVCVLITCCGESVDVIINTVVAAAAQDYPTHRHGVFVLDDGHDRMLRKAVEELNSSHKARHQAAVTYLSRKLENGFRSYFKAGNLQFGIEETRRSQESEYIAALDADMIPRPDWLRKMVPHLILDDKLAMACSPQVGALHHPSHHTHQVT